MFDYMAKILISLIGDQTAPNIFMMRDERFRSIDRHVFITTEKMEALGRLAHLLDATDLQQANYQKLLVSADDFTDILDKMAELNLSPDDEYFLNLTSGTKIMSLALFHFFTEGNYRVRIFYLPFQKNEYRQFFPLHDREIVELSHRINLEDYLTVYGIAWEPDLPAWPASDALTERLLAIYTRESRANQKRAFLLLKNLREIYDRGMEPEAIHVQEINGLAPWLQEINFPIGGNGRLTPAQTRFLMGGWLEQWAAGVIRTQLQLPDEAVGLGVKIRPQRLDLEGFGRNEFDVMFLHRNTLYILECKTGLGYANRSDGLPVDFDQALYRLAALRMEFGMNVRTALLTPDIRLRRKAKLKPVAAARAQLLKVTVIDRHELLQGPAHWIPQLVNG